MNFTKSEFRTYLVNAKLSDEKLREMSSVLVVEEVVVYTYWFTIEALRTWRLRYFVIVLINVKSCILQDL